MRRYMTALGVAGLVAAGAASALAARPPSNRSFGGTGTNYWNRSGHWAGHGRGSFSFRTSPPGFFHYVNSFRGTYNVPCHSGATFHVSATNILIQKSGAFSHTFSDPRTHAHFRIWGIFTTPTTAKVNYLVNFAGSNVNTGGNNSSCAAWVHGIAHAR